MDLEERQHLQDYVEGLLAGWGVEGRARVNERLVGRDSRLASHDEVIEVRLPEAARALGARFATRLGDFVANFLKAKGRKSVVAICEAGGRHVRRIEIDDVPET
jgi:hypothetical protein